MISDFGADAVRLFILSDSPPSKDLEWSEKGIEGSHKFLMSFYKYIIRLDFSSKFKFIF